LPGDRRHYEQFLVNSLGSVELWALSTHPRHEPAYRSYEKVVFSEVAGRLSKVFPNGFCNGEIERSTTKGAAQCATAADRVRAGVVD